MPLKSICRQLLLLLLLPYSVMAQNLTLKNFKQADGLPSNEVYDIFQDKNGIMWFATDRGLANYNGAEFKKFAPKDGLTDITIFDFFPQENGQVWCSTFNGKLFFFDDGSEKFKAYPYNHVIEKFIKDNKLAGFFITSLAVNAQKELHFFITSGCYVKINAAGKLIMLSKYKLPTTSPRFFHHKRINKQQVIYYFSNEPSEFPPYYVTKESLKRMFGFQDAKIVFTEKTVWMYRKGKTPLLISKGNFEPLEGGEYDKDHFWLSYRGKGVFVYDKLGKVVRRFLDGHSVSRVFKDCFNSLWFSTVSGGVFYQKEEKIARNILKGVYVNSLTKDNNDNLFLGCYNGDIYKKDKEGELTVLHRGITNKPAIAQYYDAEKSTYFLVDEMLFTSAGKKIECAGVLKVSDDTEKIIISRFGVFNTVSNAEYQFTDTLTFRIHDVSERNGNYYFASVRGLKISEKGRLPGIKNPLLHYRFDDLDYEPVRKVFYLASLGAGVVIYNPVTGKTVNIDASKGLSNDLVTEVYIEDKNTVWACTNYGLNRITFRDNGTFEVRYITTSDGLSENQIRDVEVIKDTIYIATANGLCSLSKKDFEGIFDKRKYFLRLKAIAVNGEIQPVFKEKLSLSYDKNQLDFWVESVSYKNKSQVYRYKLEGLHTNWNYTKDRKIAYEFIPPGNYRLKVQVLEDNRLFSDEKIILPIQISEPFWKRSWFICLIVFLTAALIYAFFKIRILTYNQDIIRELLRLWVRKIKKKEKYFTFREQGKEIRIKTDTILYVKSSGNYIDVITREKSYTIRCKIGEFITKVPDPLEFLRVHRSYIVRIDQVAQKNKKAVFVNQQEIPVGETYLDELDKIVF